MPAQKKDGLIEQLKKEKTDLSQDVQDTKIDTKNWTLAVGESSPDGILLSEKDTIIKELQAEKDQFTKDLDAVCARVKEVCCAEGWTYFSGSCYYVSTGQKTWTESRAACVAEGGDLVVISSREEQEFLKRSYGGYVEQRYWVGLTDAVKEGDWRWLDGTRLSETSVYWIGREPDNWKGDRNQYPEGENCAEMLLHTSSYYLRDSFCDVEVKKE
ncbi:hypothetical protein NFI96_029377, partial [Prochilodus magdalenae]